MSKENENSIKFKILITGGAGFIGSNIIDAYIENPKISLIRVIDDLSNGNMKNIIPYLSHPKFEFIKADICDYNVCLEGTKGIDKVSHQAALGSVPRSISNPMRSTEVNILGTVNLLHACYQNKVERIVMACSSSTYGDSLISPKVEHTIGKPLSPYAITKFTIELYAEIFNKLYGLNYIGLRYFNVFGPRQDPENPYAAVIPIFCKKFIKNESPIINGDGETSRDFTYISNVVHANDLALFSENESALNQIYNVACGQNITLNQIVDHLKLLSNNYKLEPIFCESRAGDIKHSKADISKITTLLNYNPKVNFSEGLQNTFEWYKKTINNA